LTRTAGGRQIGASFITLPQSGPEKSPCGVRKVSIGEAKKSVNFTKKSVVESLDFELIPYQKKSIEAFSQINTGETC
jgi:hypothetical protein